MSGARQGVHGADASSFGNDRPVFWVAVLTEWECLRADTSFVSSLYDSLPSRMAAVIDVNGELTRYRVDCKDSVYLDCAGSSLKCFDSVLL